MQNLLRLVFLLLLGCFGSGCATWFAGAPGEKVLRNREFARRDSQRLYLDVFLPAERSHPVPLVMWIHGGGWALGEKGLQLFIRKLTQEGFAVASIDYRLSNVARFPAQFEDSRDAFRFLQAHSDEYGVDRHRFYLAGASAGGHLASLLGLQIGRPEVRAVFAMYPPTDLNGFDNQDRRSGYLPWLLGGPVTEKRSLAISGSPVNYVRANAPPFLFMHGDADRLVPIAQSQALDRRLRAAGVESHLEVEHGQGHGFGLTAEQLKEVATFLRRH